MIKNYSFHRVEKCNMCASKTFRIIGKRLNNPQGFFPQKKTGISVTIKKCNHCNLIFSDPQPIPESLSNHYGVLPEHYWKEEYFVVNDNYFKTEIDWLKKIKTIEPGMKSLDIGAGIGKQMISLKNIGFDAHGIEPSSEFRERALNKMGVPQDKLQLASIEDAMFDEKSFDFISFGVVLEHIYNPHEALKKAISWLKDDGIIHLEVPNSNWLIGKLINFSYHIRGLDYVGNLSPMHTPYHLHEFDLKSFQENGKINGFDVFDYKYFVCQTYMPPVLDHLTRFWMKTFKNQGMQLSVMLKKSFDAQYSK